ISANHERASKYPRFEDVDSRSQDRLGRLFVTNDIALCINQVKVAADHTDLGMLTRELDLTFGLLGKVEIVVAQPAEPIARHLTNADVESRRHATVRLLDITNAITVAGGGVSGPSAVSRPVVNHDDFDFAVRLRQGAIDRRR